jgi:aspartyl-tRNA(Asn)/glutamyl-tRNA(Gln) amidotransferase subunit C
MQVDDALIEKLSKLSMLRLDEGEKEELKKELEKMIGFIDQLQKLDTSGTDPLLHMSHLQNVLREDIVAGMITREEAFINAPDQDGIFFKVPKVIKKPEES